MLSIFRKNKAKTLAESISIHKNARRARSIMPESTDRLASVIALLLDQPDWDYAIDKDASLKSALYAAGYMGIYQPYSREAQQLVDYLTGHFAGQKIAMFAFGLYADLLKEPESLVS